MAKTKTAKGSGRQRSTKEKNGRAKSLENLKMWQPGQSGNPTGIKGRTKNHPITDEIERQLLADNGKELKELIVCALKYAKKGDFRYFEEILQRIDGKMASIARIGGDPDGVPINMALAHLSVNELLKIVAATEPNENGS